MLFVTNLYKVFVFLNICIFRYSPFDTCATIRRICRNAPRWYHWWPCCRGPCSSVFCSEQQAPFRNGLWFWRGWGWGIYRPRAIWPSGRGHLPRSVAASWRRSTWKPSWPKPWASQGRLPTRQQSYGWTGAACPRL